jgi:predicted transcriptional regulator
LNKTINQGLKDLDLGPSKKKSATLQIRNAEILLTQLSKDIQKIQDENTDLAHEQRQLLGISRYRTKDTENLFKKIEEQIEDIRENHGNVSVSVHLQTNPAITKEDTSTGYQLVQGGLESMKKYWMMLKSDVDTAAVRIPNKQGASQGE